MIDNKFNRILVEKMKKRESMLSFFLVLSGMLLLSALILLVLSAVMLKNAMTPNFVAGGVISVYVISSLVGGFLIGQIKGRQKFIWGGLIGVSYFFVLFLAGKIIYHSGLHFDFQTVSSGLICAVSGMIGGMIAPAVYKS